MKVIFTICSNNYLAQAKALGDTIFLFHPDYHFVIGLVDSLNEEVDYSFFKPYEIIQIESIYIDGFDEMLSRYNITELNTSVKPYIFNYLFARDKNIDAIIYLDPDILIYRKLEELEQGFLEHNIILTPHFFTPIYDKFLLSEPSILNAGLYNLGFIGVKRSVESQRFLDWWMIKLKDQCYIDFENGLFVDQLWINLVPVYYEKVLILRHMGYNVAYWNLHERVVTYLNGIYLINEHFPLVFFHFSGYHFDKPDIISKYQTRYTFEQRPDIKDLFSEYSERVMNNGYAGFSKLDCYYLVKKQAKIEQQLAEQRAHEEWVKSTEKKPSLLQKILRRCKLSLRILLKGR